MRRLKELSHQELRTIAALCSSVALIMLMALSLGAPVPATVSVATAQVTPQSQAASLWGAITSGLHTFTCATIGTTWFGGCGGVGGTAVAPTVTLKAEPNPTDYGHSTQLDWYYSGFGTCTLSGGEFGGGVSVGVREVRSTGALYAPTTYTVACGSGQGGDSSNKTAVSTAQITVDIIAPPVSSSIDALYADKTLVVYNESTTVHWRTTNMASCSMDRSDWSPTRWTDSLNRDAATGALTDTAVFTLTCRDSFSRTFSAQTMVSVAQPAISIAARAESGTYLAGSATNPAGSNYSIPTVSVPYNTPGYIRWSASSISGGSCHAYVREGYGSARQTGGRNFQDGDSATDLSTGPVVKPLTYTVACLGRDGMWESSVTVVPGTPPAANITVNPASVLWGGTTKVSWSAPSAQTCQVRVTDATHNRSSWDDKTSGTDVPAGGIVSQTTFTLECQYADGSSQTKQAVVTPRLPDLAIAASPSSVIEGGTTYVSWDGSGAQRCGVYVTDATHNQSSWNDGLQGLRVAAGGITSPTTFTLRCTYQNGAVQTKQAQVTIRPPTSGTIGFLTADPGRVRRGEKTKLSWNTTGMLSCSVYDDLALTHGISGTLASSGMEVEIVQKTVFTLVCLDDYATHKLTTTVDVLPGYIER